ncbi:MAG: type IV pilus twitching motility protein PilT [Candidatus Binatia bacterium]
MTVDAMLSQARSQGASDLHLEPGLPPTLRIGGELIPAGPPLDPAVTTALARELVGEADWREFERKRSADCSRTLGGTRCRINVMHSIRGIGIAVRLLSSVQPTLARLNLHPELKPLIDNPHGLVLVSGPTGSGKSSTLAALIHEINLAQAVHVLTVEEPIEYVFHPRRAFVRQREVGRDTPSFEQALVDALREDPDVVMVGEMRVPEVMRLTLNIAETGHLTFATVHSSSCAEALQRIVSAFPSEIQSGVQAQLADCITAVICQRLHYSPKWKIRLPELEVLMATPAVRNLVRQGHYFKLPSALATGAQEGMWTFERYRQWMEAQPRWYTSSDASREAPDTEGRTPEGRPAAAPKAPAPETAPAAAPADQVFDIQQSEEDLSSILSQLKR